VVAPIRAVSACPAPDLTHKAAHDQAEAEHSGRPTEERAALQAPGQPERAAQRAAAMCVAGALRQHAMPEVAPCAQQRRPGNAREEQGHCQAQRPPVVTAERAHLLAPADRGQPGRPSAAHPQAAGIDVTGHVADPAGQERHTEDSGGQTARAAGTGGQLSGDRGHAGERHANGGDRGPSGERAGRRLPSRDHPQTQQERQRGVGADRHNQGGGQTGVATHNRSADHLGAAGLLALPGMAHHGERAHQRGKHRDQEVVTDHGVPADASSRRQAQHPDSGAGRRDPRLLDQVDHTAVLIGPQGCGPGGERGQPEHPGRKGEPVAAQRQPDQRGGTGHGVHGAPARLARPRSATPPSVASVSVARPSP